MPSDRRRREKQFRIKLSLRLLHLMYVLRITGGMVDDFERGQLVPVFDEPPDDEHVIRSEADFDVHFLAHELRQWEKAGRSEEEFRETLREAWPAYANVAFPGRKSWLLRQEADALADLDLGEWLEMTEFDEAVKEWGLA